MTWRRPFTTGGAATSRSPARPEYPVPGRSPPAPRGAPREGAHARHPRGRRPGSTTASSTSVPSGRSIGSSTSSLPAFTRPLRVSVTQRDYHSPSSRLRRRSASALRALRALRTPRCGPLSRLSAAGRARRSRGFGRGSDRDAAAGERGDCRRDRGRIRVIDRTHTSGFNVIVVDPRSSSRCSSSAGRVDAAGQEEQ